MHSKTIWQWTALVSFVLGIGCVAVGFIDYHGSVGTVAAFLIVPFYLIALWCVLFKPRGEK